MNKSAQALWDGVPVTGKSEADKELFRAIQGECDDARRERDQLKAQVSELREKLRNTENVMETNDYIHMRLEHMGRRVQESAQGIVAKQPVIEDDEFKSLSLQAIGVKQRLEIAALNKGVKRVAAENSELKALNAELLEALVDLFAADMEHVLMGDGKDDQIEAIAKARAAIAKAGD